MSVPTSGETFAKLLYHLDEVMNCAATLAHLARAEANAGKSRAIADGWIAVCEMFKRIRFQVTKLAQGRLQ